MTDSGTPPGERRSGWERADAVVTGAGTVVRGIGWVMIRVYALAIIAIGIAVVALIPDTSRLVGLLVVAYGVYLLFGGSWIIY